METEEDIIKECKINFLQYEYNRYSKIIYNQIQHIGNLYENNIMSLNDRNHHLKTLSEIIRFMNNDIYNEKLKTITDNISINIDDISDAPEFDADDKSTNNVKPDGILSALHENSSKQNLKLCEQLNNSLMLNNGKNIEIILEMCKGNNISSISDIIFDDFNKVKSQLLAICGYTGFNSLTDAIDILMGKKHLSNLLNNKQFAIYNSVFVIVNYKSHKYTSNNIELYSYLEWQLADKIENSEIYVDTYGELTVYIPENEHKIVFGGYFINDPVHSIIRTSQISNTFIYNKKRKFQAIIENEITGIVYKFADIYLKNISIGELLSYDDASFKTALMASYNKYINITKMKSFKNQLEEFTRDNSIKNMFSIIKLLLMGPNDCINIAGLLFGLTKDKKYNAEIIADIIYKKLPYTLQTRLKKSSINLKNELDKLKALSETDIDNKKQIAANTTIPLNIKKLLMDKLDEMKSGSNESGKQKIYCDILMRYPWQNTDTTFDLLHNDYDKCRAMMDNIYTTLNSKIYGHNECKSTIREIVCKMIMNPKSGGKALGLVGPPGVGKTLIAKKLGDALGIPCSVISLCGVEDGAVLCGHGYTYSGAMPGMIVRKMVEAGSARCIMFFDELDKACQKHGVNEIQNIMINITDPNMNKTFNDKFFDCSFPLDKVIFVFSYNDKSKIDPILLNRIHEIEVGSYTVKDKLKICQDFLLNEIHDDIGLEHKSIIIADEDIEYITENYTHEPGVRELKRKLESLFLKLNVDRIYQKNAFKCPCVKGVSCNDCTNCNNCNDGNYIDCKKCNSCVCNIKCVNKCKTIINSSQPVYITRDTIIHYLKKPKHDTEKIHKDPLIGVINGVYATTTGFGGILPILIYKYNGSENFTLHLSGSLGNVMKESIGFAFTIATNLIKTEYIEAFFNECKRGLHIHAPDGATNKDGPSAGGAITSAFISRILNKKIRNNCAMTGEISLNGNITAIGGLIYKMRGAKAAGVNLFFCPEANRKDYDIILKKDSELFDENFQVCIVSHIREVIPKILLEDDGSELDCNKYFC